MSFTLVKPDVASWPRRIADFWLGWIPRTLRAALNLTGEQRQTLMSWGLVGGIVALTGVKLLRELFLRDRWLAGAIDGAVMVAALFDQSFWDTLLQAALALGMVAIARGGSMAVKIDKGGVVIDFAASGQAAKQLATDSNIAAATAAADPDPAPPLKGSGVG